MTLVARSGALTDIGLHRKTNEDTFVVAPPLFAVCDGMGGAQAGEVASGLAAETLAAGVADGRLAAGGRRGGQRRRLRSAPGTTAPTPAWARRSPPSCSRATSGHFVHIGDSRAYLLRDGELQQISDDHSLVGEMVRDGRLTKRRRPSHPHRSILSRALGTESAARHRRVRRRPARRRRAAALQRRAQRPVAAPARPRRRSAFADPDDAAEMLIAEARKTRRPRQHHRRRPAPRGAAPAEVAET